MVSCEILGVNPFRWLKHTLENIRPDMEELQLTGLLPCNFEDKI
ncbi:transposase domain-containing protein [Parabacteroides sp. ZJ-118]